jgi:hypothetical protein
MREGCIAKGMEPSNVLVRPAVSERLRTSWPKEATCVAGDIIIPVPPTLEADTIRNDSGTLSVKIAKPQVELGFITIVHKAQGATLDRSSISYIVYINTYSLELIHHPSNKPRPMISSVSLDLLIGDGGSWIPLDSAISFATFATFSYLRRSSSLYLLSIL